MGGHGWGEAGLLWGCEGIRALLVLRRSCSRSLYSVFLFMSLFCLSLSLSVLSLSVSCLSFLSACPSLFPLFCFCLPVLSHCPVSLSCLSLDVTGGLSEGQVGSGWFGFQPLLKVDPYLTLHGSDGHIDGHLWAVFH